MAIVMESGLFIHFSREELEEASDHFNTIPVHRGGCKIGEREFGSVYKGILKHTEVAIKVLLNSAVIPKVRERWTPNTRYLFNFMIRMKEVKNWSHST